jgi:hypothetical protein
MEIVKQLLLMIVFAVIILIVYNILKVYVLNKININKWIVLALGILVLFLPGILISLGVKLPNNSFWQFIPSGIFIILFLWFMDLNGWMSKKTKSSTSSTYTGYGKKDKKKDVIIKPKAKPNRVKNKKK